MSILRKDIVFYGSNTMAEDDVTQQVGGAIDVATKVSFQNIAVNGNIQVVSDNAGDVSQTVTVTGRNPSGVVITEGKTLNGLTPVAMTTNTNWERLLKAVKSASCAGNVAAELVTPEHSGTAVDGEAETSSVMAYLNLDAAASGVDNEYNGCVLRITAGTGAGQIRRVVFYDGTEQRAYIHADWSVVPDATSTFKISRGMLFEKTPNEILECRTIFYGAAADNPGGSARNYYEKIFISNEHGSLTLTETYIKEITDPTGQVDFALESALDGNDTNGAGNNRLVAPGGYSFDSLDKQSANSGNLTAGAAQGVWLRLNLPAGDRAEKTLYEIGCQGVTV
jgi:hypothetical protein